MITRMGKIQRRIRELGYCCYWGFFEQNRSLTAIELAEVLQCCERTAKYWRKKFKTKQIDCLEKTWGFQSNCFKAHRS